MNMVFRLPVLLLSVALIAVACKNSRKSQEKESAEVTQPQESNRPAPDQLVESERQGEEMHVPESQEVIAQYQPEYPDSLFFRMAKTPCFGKCPVYTVNIYRSGHATLHGKRFFDYEGDFVTRFTTEEMQQIEEAAEKTGYFGLRHVYDAPVTDLPSTTTVLRTETAEHWAYNRMNSPDALRDFEQACEKLVKGKTWLEVEKKD